MNNLLQNAKTMGQTKVCPIFYVLWENAQKCGENVDM